MKALSRILMGLGLSVAIVGLLAAGVYAGHGPGCGCHGGCAAAQSCGTPCQGCGCPTCCGRCGCACKLQRVCRLVCEEQEVKFHCFACKCEDYCVPCRSKRGCRVCDRVCTKCDGCCDEGCCPYQAPCSKSKKFTWFQWFPGCAKVQTRKRLLTKVVTRKIPVYRWEVEYLCPRCESCCTGAVLPEAVEMIPMPPNGGTLKYQPPAGDNGGMTPGQGKGIAPPVLPKKFPADGPDEGPRPKLPKLGGPAPAGTASSRLFQFFQPR